MQVSPTTPPDQREGTGAAPGVPGPRSGSGAAVPARPDGATAVPGVPVVPGAPAAPVVRRAARLRRYEQRTDLPLMLAAAAFLVVYALPVLWTTMPVTGHALCDTADTLLWIAFATDLVVRTTLHEDRVRFLLRHPIDVLVVVVPVLRPLRVLRVFTAAQMLSRRGGLLRSGRALASAAALFVAIGALAELDAERSAPGATITTLGDALWWALSTVTTVGYGDLYPVTTDGRLVAAGLMIVGVSFIGTITATIGAWFMAQQHEDTERETSEIHALATQVAALREELAADRARREG